MPRILNVEPDGYSPRARAILQTVGQVDDEHELTRAELLERIGDYEVLIVRLKHRIDRELLAQAGRLQVVVSATTGVDHLDLETMTAQGITALTLRGETAFLETITATAEHTWALLLALRRHLPRAMQMGAAGHWDRDQVRGHELAGGTLGIVGYGRLGKIVAAYGQAFRMRVVVYDPYVQAAAFEQVNSLAALVSQSDVISLHVPLNDATVHLVDAALLQQFKPGSLLINTARGQVVDSVALLDALQSGKLAGAALDVIEGEHDPDLSRHPLVQYAATHPNLIITPHIGGATFESMANTEIFMAQKLADFFQKAE